MNRRKYHLKVVPVKPLLRRLAAVLLFILMGPAFADDGRIAVISDPDGYTNIRSEPAEKAAEQSQPPKPKSAVDIFNQLK